MGEKTRETGWEVGKGQRVKGSKGQSCRVSKIESEKLTVKRGKRQHYLLLINNASVIASATKQSHNNSYSFQTDYFGHSSLVMTHESVIASATKQSHNNSYSFQTDYFGHSSLVMTYESVIASVTKQSHK